MSLETHHREIVELGQRMADALARYMAECGFCRWLKGNTEAALCSRCVAATELLDEWETA